MPIREHHYAGSLEQCSHLRITQVPVVHLDTVTEGNDHLLSFRIQNAWSGDSQPSGGRQCPHASQQNVYALIALNSAKKQNKFFSRHSKLLMTEKSLSEATMSDDRKLRMRREFPGLLKMLGGEYMNRLGESQNRAPYNGIKAFKNVAGMRNRVMKRDDNRYTGQPRYKN
jgi:hypothetical protein